MRGRIACACALAAVACAALLVVAPSVRAAETFQLKTFSLHTDTGPIQYVTSASCARLSRKPEGATLPKDASPNVVWYASTINGGRRIILWDRQAGDKVWFDATGKGNLADATALPIAGVVKHRRYGDIAYCGPVAIESADKGGKTGQAVVLAYKGRGIAVCPAVCNRGKVTFGGKELTVITCDGNINGAYSDKLTKIDTYFWRHKPDVFAIDRNGDGNISPNAAESELLPVSDYVQVDGKYYAISVSDDGTEVTVDEATPAMGTLKSDQPGLRLTGVGTTAMLDVDLKDATAQVPAGKYLPTIVKLTQKDDAGATWVLQCTGKVGNKVIDVTQGATATVPYGAPLTIKPDVQVTPHVVTVNASLYGNAGEEYAVSITRDGRALPAPSVTIKDADGKQLVASKLEYG